MKKLIVKLLFLITIVVFTNLKTATAQEVEGYLKNSLYVSVGTVLFSSQVSFSYERTILEKKDWRTKVKLNYGHYLYNGLDYDTNEKVNDNFLSLSAVQLIGLVELNGGLAYSRYKLASGFDPEPNVDYTQQKERYQFYGNIGVRYEKNNFMFRGGIGNLEFLYLGLGVNF